jgi:histidyl-tRNA synthetase
MMDRGDRKIAVRPEMTPTMARLVAGKIQELPRPIRLFSIPNLWRYERPQRGRLREHWQLNVDVLGGDSLFADAEILTVAVEIIRAFGGSSQMVAKVNHRQLMDEFFLRKLKLAPDQAYQVVKAIDAKNKIDEEKFKNWVREAGVQEAQFAELDWFFSATLDEVAKEMPCAGVDHLQKLFALLGESGVSGSHVVFDPTIMRGLDYYTGTVFEIYDTSPENRRAMFGGGRYDNLMGIFGKEALSGVGFGMGDVSLQHFIEAHQLAPKFESEVDVMITLPKREYRLVAEELARDLRGHGLKVITPLNIGKFGDQLKLANRHEAKFVILFGDDEFARGEVLVKNLKTGEQKTVPQNQVTATILS